MIKCPKCESKNVSKFCADCGAQVNADSPSLWALSECLAWAERRHNKSKGDEKPGYYLKIVTGLKEAIQHEQHWPNPDAVAEA